MASKTFVICGSVYRAFYSKEDNTFLVKTNETWSGKSFLLGCQLRVVRCRSWNSSTGSIPGKEQTQPMAKWASRFSLGLSTSAPGFRLDREQIEFKDDIVNETNAK
ncbi:hypothetical protein FA13DRAFT_1277522 [Coprinellus micaceus]|uniref:RNA-dependent RNA polymerase n=1 Tax=Coprinellus micaceus TaxID=71717 RepID=A0A4Y7R8M0_COPMI|nr:hypothetical protein FA13DRAFT_1277522 [Coprinellus micaceus]